MGTLNLGDLTAFVFFLEVVKNLVKFFHGVQVWQTFKNAKNRCSTPAHTRVYGPMLIQLCFYATYNGMITENMPLKIILNLPSPCRQGRFYLVV